MSDTTTQDTHVARERAVLARMLTEYDPDRIGAPDFPSWLNGAATALMYARVGYDASPAPTLVRSDYPEIAITLPRLVGQRDHVAQLVVDARIPRSLAGETVTLYCREIAHMSDWAADELVRQLCTLRGCLTLRVLGASTDTLPRLVAAADRSTLPIIIETFDSRIGQTA